MLIIDLVLPSQLLTFNNDFPILLHDTNIEVGFIWIDDGTDSEFTNYFGNIGYQIKKEYQGNKYALKALIILKEILLDVNFKEMIFSIDATNISSIKTVELFGAKLIRYVDAPNYHKLYDLKGQHKLIYKYDIKKEDK